MGEVKGKKKGRKSNFEPYRGMGKNDLIAITWNYPPLNKKIHPQGNEWIVSFESKFY